MRVNSKNRQLRCFQTVLFPLPQSVSAVVSDITSTNVTTLILGLVCLVFLYVIKDLNERFKKKLPIPIPGEIIVVIVSTGVSYGLLLSEDYSVGVVGKIPTGYVSMLSFFQVNFWNVSEDVSEDCTLVSGL